jgi:hypothetical protein
MRSMVEGVSDSTLHFQRKKFVEARAPPTILRACALRMVPPPRFRGAGEGKTLKARISLRHPMDY